MLFRSHPSLRGGEGGRWGGNSSDSVGWNRGLTRRAGTGILRGSESGLGLYAFAFQPQVPSRAAAVLVGAVEVPVTTLFARSVMAHGSAVLSGVLPPWSEGVSSGYRYREVVQRR